MFLREGSGCHFHFNATVWCHICPAIMNMSSHSTMSKHLGFWANMSIFCIVHTSLPLSVSFRRRRVQGLESIIFHLAKTLFSKKWSNCYELYNIWINAMWSNKPNTNPPRKNTYPIKLICILLFHIGGRWDIV